MDRHRQKLRIMRAWMPADHIHGLTFPFTPGDRIMAILFGFFAVDLYRDHAPAWPSQRIECDRHSGGAWPPTAIELPWVLRKHHLQFAFQIGFEFLSGDPA